MRKIRRGLPLLRENHWDKAEVQEWWERLRKWPFRYRPFWVWPEVLQVEGFSTYRTVDLYPYCEFYAQINLCYILFWPIVDLFNTPIFK